MTQLTLGAAVAAFAENTDECPMAPHTKHKSLTGKVAEVKNVKELRESMGNGRSTRQWKQDEQDSNKFTKTDHLDANKKPEPRFDSNPILIAGETYPLSIAAHHLIPGKASLPKSDLKKYIWKKGGQIDGDIAYDVDGAENGKWLPTHQIMSYKMGKSQAICIIDDTKPDETKGMSWKNLSARSKEKEGNEASYTASFLPRYTRQAMDLMNAQFHDSHSEYSKYVTKKLNNMSARIKVKSGFCDECKKNAVKSPPYLLVYRLNNLSSELDRLLSGDPRPVWSKIYTSKFSGDYWAYKKLEIKSGRT